MSEGALPEPPVYAPGLAKVEWAALIAHLRSSRYRLFRDVFDPIAATILLLMLSPLILAIALAVLLDAGRPIFFLQWRAGRFTRPFRIVKFRTMSTRAPRSSLKVALDDPLITRVGRFLRRSGLDELPNLWNVVRGEMALIGPRPEQLALLGYYDPWHHLRHLIKPGITGWWQIHHRDSEPMHVNVEKDISYVCNQSLVVDLRIVGGTLKLAASAIPRPKRTPRLGTIRSREVALDRNASAVVSEHRLGDDFDSFDTGFRLKLRQ